MTLQSSFFCFMQDVLDVGADEFCDALGALGITGVTVASHYHASRDLRPRGTGGRLADFSPGASYFPSDAARYPEAMPPWTPEPFASRDVLAELAAACASRGMSLASWTVYGFDERTGRADPSLCQRGVFGDPYTSDLCPANPRVVDGYLAMTRDIASRGPGSIVAESLHFHGLRLSRRFVPMDAWTMLALGLCFCEHCVRAADAAGTDAARVADWARGLAEQAFAGGTTESATPIDRSELGAACDGELERYLRVRASIVEDVTSRVAAAATAAGSSLRFMDQAAADSAVVGPRVIDEAFRAGVDVERIGLSGVGYEVLGYRQSADAVAQDLADYRSALPPGASIRVALRPSPPDSSNADNLESKLRAAVLHGADGVDFYHYGLVAGDALARVRDAIERVG